MLGFRPYESGNINIVIKNPKKNALALANRLHDKIKPDTAIIYATVKTTTARMKLQSLDTRAMRNPKTK